MAKRSLCALFAVILSIICSTVAFAPTSRIVRPNSKGVLTMKWMFGKGNGPLQEVGGIGSQGEYYYIPSKRPTLKAPAAALGKERTIPLFPRNQVLGPLGEDYLGVYEMRYRQLLNDIGENGVFGHVYYSQENSKIALVGTLAKIKKTERLDDGGLYVVMEGVGRFYTRDVIAEKPYLKARVQIFNDYTENESLLATLEQKVMDEVRYSVKIMKILYPQNNYTMNDLVLRYRPQLYIPGVRNVVMQDPKAELERRSKFSFATMDMLKTDPVTKLLFLQEPVLEKRYANVLKVLEESTVFLEGELRKRGVTTEEGIRKLKRESLEDRADIETTSNSNWFPHNFVDGDWKMRPTLMD